MTTSVIATPGGRASHWANEAVHPDDPAVRRYLQGLMCAMSFQRARRKERSRDLRGSHRCSLDVEALHPIAQLPEGDTEQLRRCGPVVAGLCQRGADRRCVRAHRGTRASDDGMPSTTSYDAPRPRPSPSLCATGASSAGTGSASMRQVDAGSRQQQVVCHQHVVAGQRDCALEDVFEFAHVAGKAVTLQRRQRRGRQSRDGTTGPLRDAREDRISQASRCLPVARAAAAL